MEEAGSIAMTKLASRLSELMKHTLRKYANTEVSAQPMHCKLLVSLYMLRISVFKV